MEESSNYVTSAKHELVNYRAAFLNEYINRNSLLLVCTSNDCVTYSLAAVCFQGAIPM